MLEARGLEPERSAGGSLVFPPTLPLAGGEGFQFRSEHGDVVVRPQKRAGGREAVCACVAVFF